MKRDRKELNWQELRDYLWLMVCDSTEETRDIVEVDVENRCIDIYPAETNVSNALFHTEEVVDFCRYWACRILRAFGKARCIHTFTNAMNVFDFNDRGQAHVSEQEFTDYLAKTAERDDYTKRVFSECQVTDKYWVMCECINYYNGGGCLLARYNLDFNYGELL